MANHPGNPASFGYQTYRTDPNAQRTNAQSIRDTGAPAQARVVVSTKGVPAATAFYHSYNSQLPVHDKDPLKPSRRPCRLGAGVADVNLSDK